MSHRYTHQQLQAEVAPWSQKIEARGFTLPDFPITLYTAGTQFDAAVGAPRGFASRQPIQGMAAQSRDGLPVVYVRLRHQDPWTVDYDPLVILIHELLHHVTPELSHAEVYSLSEELRDRKLTAGEEEERSRAQEERARAELAAIKESAAALERHGMDLLESLERSAYEPRRSAFRSHATGRYAKDPITPVASRFAPNELDTVKANNRAGVLDSSPTRHDRFSSGKPRTSFPTRSETMTKLAKKNATTKKPAAKKVAETRITKRASAETVKTSKGASTPAPEPVAMKVNEAKTTQTPDQQRERKNAALRAWRSAHAEQQRAYRAQWVAARKAKQAIDAQGSETPIEATTAKKSKKGGSA